MQEVKYTHTLATLMSQSWSIYLPWTFLNEKMEPLMMYVSMASSLTQKLKSKIQAQWKNLITKKDDTGLLEIA